ncbi:MAG: hypothetical protein U0223_11960 [Nitrospira sp.]|nr:hypothetical protein [Nitrospira sp.]
MLFVHLSDVRNVVHIKKHGLRTEGDGRWTGVYCVPLLQMEQERWVDGWIKNLMPTTIKSTALLWKFWMKQKRRRRGRPVAIIFKVPRGHWPAELTLELRRGRGALFYHGCRMRDVAMILPNAIDPESVKWLKEVGNGLWHFLVSGESHLKQLLREYERTGTKPFSGDIFQLMFYKPIPSRYIQRIIPLDQRNHTFKERKSSRRTRKVFQHEDD